MSIVSIMEYPAEIINICEGMGMAVRNVKHIKGWHFVILEFGSMSEPETAMRQVAQLLAYIYI